MASIGKSKLSCDSCLYGTLYDDGCIVCKECECNPKIGYWEEAVDVPFESSVDQTESENVKELRKRGIIK